MKLEFGNLGHIKLRNFKAEKERYEVRLLSVCCNKHIIPKCDWERTKGGSAGITLINFCF